MAEATPRPAVYTPFVRESLVDPDWPERRRMEVVLKALRRDVRRELKRRGLWDSSPTYVGVAGVRWSGEGPDTPRAFPRDPLDELTQDCFTFNFVERLQALQVRVLRGENIDGIVGTTNVRHLVHDRQRKHDPLGYRLFEVLHRAIGDVVASGSLFLLGHHPSSGGKLRIRNPSLLSFVAPPLTSPIALQELDPIVARWSDELMPALAAATGRRRDEVVRQLALRILELKRAGVVVFRFKDLMDALKHRVRERWALCLSDDGLEIEADVRSEPLRLDWAVPGHAFETHDSLAKLNDCVALALEREEAHREDLLALWEMLRLWLSEHDQPPAANRISSLLGIPRHRQPALFERLRREVTACQAALAGGGSRSAVRGG